MMIRNNYRLLFPLNEPFLLHPERPDEHAFRCAWWREQLMDLAERELNLTIDESGCDVNRLFYTPRHKPRDPNWDLTIFAGPALEVDQPPLSDVRPRERVRGRGGRKLIEPPFPSSPRPILSDGFDLVDWKVRFGMQFKVREFFACLDWETGSDDPSLFEGRILCPNDAAHSTPDDRHACWIKDGNGEDHFALYCHHNSCRESGLGALEQLVIVEGSTDLPNEYKTLSQMLCDPEFYEGDNPERQRFLRWDPRAESAAQQEGESQ